MLFLTAVFSFKELVIKYLKTAKSGINVACFGKKNALM